MALILVVDDERAVVEMVAFALSRLGHSVQGAYDGKEAIEKFDGNCFDMVITDWNMPLVNGQGLLTHIRRSVRHKTPVIAISGTPWLIEARACFDAVLPKPVPIRTLFKTVQQLTARTGMALAC